MTLPDRIAYTRIAVVPIVMALILAEDRIAHSYGLALTLFVVAAASDFLDGYLARRWNITSVLGGFLDSVADKLLVLGALAALVEVGRAWSWVLWVIIGREIAVMGLRGVAAMGQSGVPPSIWGKIKATVQFVAIGFALIRSGSEIGPFYLDEWLMLVAVAVTLASGWEYFLRFRGVFRSVQERHGAR